jgi:hypothetical protein
LQQQARVPSKDNSTRIIPTAAEPPARRGWGTPSSKRGEPGGTSGSTRGLGYLFTAFALWIPTEEAASARKRLVRFCSKLRVIASILAGSSVLRAGARSSARLQQLQQVARSRRASTLLSTRTRFCRSAGRGPYGQPPLPRSIAQRPHGPLRPRTAATRPEPYPTGRGGG